jgi:hypothetical protein
MKKRRSKQRILRCSATDLPAIARKAVETRKRNETARKARLSAIARKAVETRKRNAKAKNWYPLNWKKISRKIIERSGGRCECRGECDLHQGRRCVERNGEPAVWAKGKVVLTEAHLNHDKSDCHDKNLRAMCNRCHLRYDRYDHWKTRSGGEGAGDESVHPHRKGPSHAPRSPRRFAGRGGAGVEAAQLCTRSRAPGRIQILRAGWGPQMGRTRVMSPGDAVHSSSSSTTALIRPAFTAATSAAWSFSFWSA